MQVYTKTVYPNSLSVAFAIIRINSHIDDLEAKWGNTPSNNVADDLLKAISIAINCRNDLNNFYNEILTAS